VADVLGMKESADSTIANAGIVVEGHMVADASG
jgi:hypothetical protein